MVGGLAYILDFIQLPFISNFIIAILCSDMELPLETSVKPFYNLLGTSEKDKRLILYETDHNLSLNEVVKESLNWLDRYLGPVK